MQLKTGLLRLTTAVASLLAGANAWAITQDAAGVYQIGTADDLYEFAQIVNGEHSTIAQNGAANAVLTSNIVVNKNVLKSDGTLNGDGSTFKSWTPIGKNESIPYSGIFNGKGHTISGLYFNDSGTTRVGFFGYITSIVNSVGLLDSYFNGGMYVGGVCGYNAGSISNSYNTGSVNGTVNVAGVCGYNTGYLSNSYNTGSVSASSQVSGVCCSNYKNGSIKNCYNTGSVNGGSDVAGVCYDNNGIISNCYNTGSLYGSKYVGGVCAMNSATISNCYNTGSVNGSSEVGGVCVSNDATINNCYCTNETIVGEGSTTNCSTMTLDQFKSGEVAYLLSLEDDDDVWGQNLGTDTIPVLGADVVYAEKVMCSSPITGYTNTKTFFGHAADDYVNGFCKRCDAYQPATKNSDGLYEIGNGGQLYWFASLVNDSSKTSANAILTADITVNQKVLLPSGALKSSKPDTFRVWTPIGNTLTKYEGSFNGKGYTVSGLYFNEPNSSCVGLFGYIDEGGKVDSIGVLSSYFNGNNNVGGVCSTNSGTISNSYNTGSMNGYMGVGGVCGCSSSSSIISNCYNTGSVSVKNEDAGGICGCSYGTISNSYNIGNVSGSSVVAGVSGYVGAYSIISNCYNTGDVNGSEDVGSVCGYVYSDVTVSNCYGIGETIVGYSYGTFTNCSTKTTAQFKSGEVAYLLSQGEGGGVWGQKLGTDNIPVFSTDVVYTVKNCKEINIYTNIKPSVEVVHAGDDYVNGFCPRCDAYQPATINSDGVYEIGNAGQLYWFASSVNNEINDSASAVLTADITVNENVLDADGELNENVGEFRKWVPISYYKGVFDGQTHVIKGLYSVRSSGNSGLFESIVSPSKIQNLGVEDSYMEGSTYVAGICAHNMNGTISNCYSSASVSSVSGKRIGCVCGYNYRGTIDHCYAYGTVGSAENFGGVVGLNNQGSVASCYYNSTKMPNMQAVDGVYGKPTSSFTSGEVAYLLQKDQTEQVWGQKLGTDTIPVFSDDKVYLYENCLGNSAYTNDESKNGVIGEHDFSQKVLTDQPNAKGLYAYVCANDASHISNYNVIKAYNGKDNLELDSTAEGEYFVEKLALRDTESFNSPVDFTANTFSYDRKPAAGIVTFMLPIDVPSGSLNGKAYYLKQFDGSTLKFKGATEIKANTPYVVKVNEKGDSLVSELNNVIVKATTSINETTVGNATHFGSYVSTTIDNDADYDYYGYKDSKFYRGKVGVSVAPFRSAVKLAKATSVVGNGKPRMSPAELNIEFDDDDATGIEITPAEIGISGKVNVYDVLGRAIRINVEAEGCLDGLQNGVYIVNGKKVIVRNY